MTESNQTLLKQFQAQRKALDEQIKETGKAAFNDMCKSVFSENPALKSFTWTQYTPYFNDGDPCRFRANTDYITVVWGDEELDEVTPRSFTRSNATGALADAVFKDVFGKIYELLKSMDNALLEAMFGDHCRVTAKPDGVQVDSYDHD